MSAPASSAITGRWCLLLYGFIVPHARAAPALSPDIEAATARGTDATALPTETERGPLFAPFNPAPDPVVPDVVNDPAWLIATSGFCSNLNVVMISERDIKGDTAAHFIADIEFNYYPQTAVKFTDFPYHKANAIEGDQNEADALASPVWDHKNIALLEPTSTCSADEQTSQAWGISVFKVEEHRACSDDETAWEGHPCVHFTGYVSAETSNFDNVNTERFVCQLFVDSGRGFVIPPELEKPLRFFP